MLDQGQDHPAGDAVVRLRDICGGELLLAEQLLHCAGRPAPGLGPVRHEVAGGDQLIQLGLLIQCGDPLRLGANLGAHLVRAGRQVEAVSPGDPLGREVEDIGGGFITTEYRLHGQRAPQVQMCVVLPGEPDAAVHLNVEFGVADVGR